MNRDFWIGVFNATWISVLFWIVLALVLMSGWQ